jgi:hypothetical protein
VVAVAPVPVPAPVPAVVAAVVVDQVAAPVAPVVLVAAVAAGEALAVPVLVAIEAALPAVARASLRRMAVEGMVHPILIFMARLMARPIPIPIPISIHTTASVILVVAIPPVQLPLMAALEVVLVALALIPHTQGTLPHPDRGLYIVPDLDSLSPSSVYTIPIRTTPPEANIPPQILRRRRAHSLFSRSSLTSRNNSIPPTRSSTSLLPRSLAIRCLRVSLLTPIPLRQPHQQP